MFTKFPSFQPFVSVAKHRSLSCPAIKCSNSEIFHSRVPLWPQPHITPSLQHNHSLTSTPPLVLFNSPSSLDTFTYHVNHSLANTPFLCSTVLLPFILANPKPDLIQLYAFFAPKARQLNSTSALINPCSSVSVEPCILLRDHSSSSWPQLYVKPPCFSSDLFPLILSRQPHLYFTEMMDVTRLALAHKPSHQKI